MGNQASAENEEAVAEEGVAVEDGAAEEGPVTEAPADEAPAEEAPAEEEPAAEPATEDAAAEEEEAQSELNPAKWMNDAGAAFSGMKFPDGGATLPEMPEMPDMPKMPKMPEMPEMPVVELPDWRLPMPTFKKAEDTYGSVQYSDQHVTVFEKGIEIKYYYHPMSESRYFFFSDIASAESGVHRDHGWGRETAEEIYWAADLFSTAGPHHIVITFKKTKLGQLGFSVCKAQGDMDKALAAINSGIVNSDGLPAAEETKQEEPAAEEPAEEADATPEEEPAKEEEKKEEEKEVEDPPTEEEERGDS